VLVISALTRVEVPSAFWRKLRIGEIEPETAALLTRTFELDFHGHDDTPPRYGVVVVGWRLLESAATLVASHDLSAADAVQLASALAVREADPDCRQFACFDARLRAAAAAAGFELVP